jgi:hypothetical protein
MPKQKKEFDQLDHNVPRQVYLAGCQAIAEGLRADGFTYLKSSQKLRRKSRDFSFEVSFQSSHNNTAGELVILWIHAHVFSITLKTWRAEHACLLKGSDFVAGGQIGNLLAQPGWLEWNLADPAGRSDQIGAAIDTIRRIAWPFFALFDDLPGLTRQLVDQGVPSFNTINALDFLMCFASPADARQASANMLARLPQAQAGYALALSSYRTQGLPAITPSAHADVLAMASIVYHFPDLRNG